MRPVERIARAATPEGELVLERRGDDHVIAVGGRIVMSSRAHRSERDLALRVCERARESGAPSVVVAGLGMGFTLRAAADALPESASITVVELTPAVVDWCRGPLAGLSGGVLGDPRVSVVVGDVFDVLRSGRARWSGIALDLWQGPFERDDRVFTAAALRACAAALEPRGRLGIWSEQSVAGFERRLALAGLVAPAKHVAARGFRHVVYVADARGGDGRSGAPQIA
jgi:spermidine synthase